MWGGAKEECGEVGGNAGHSDVSEMPRRLP
jgi:hypothetical protein